MINHRGAELAEYRVQRGRVEEEIIVQRLGRASSHHWVVRHEAVTGLTW